MNGASCYTMSLIERIHWMLFSKGNVPTSTRDLDDDGPNYNYSPFLSATYFVDSNMHALPSLCHDMSLSCHVFVESNMHTLLAMRTLLGPCHVMSVSSRTWRHCVRHWWTKRVYRLACEACKDLMTGVRGVRGRWWALVAAAVVDDLAAAVKTES